LRELDAQASDRSIRYRFFTAARSVAARYTEIISAAPQTETRESIVAVVADRVVGLATLEQTADDTAEVALLIADAEQHEGIGTLLVEELVIAAHRRRLAKLTADVLIDNFAMLRVLRDLGLPIAEHCTDGVVEVRIDLGDDSVLAARITERERSGEVASLASVLTPASIALIGVGSRENSVGRAVLRNLLQHGFTGDVTVVHPRHTEILGVPTVASIAQLPAAPDLAIVAVPAQQVPTVVAELGQRGARAALLLTSGFGEVGASGGAAQRDLVRSAREHGMRLVGPNCLGIVNTDPTVRLNATFAALPLRPGGLALASQSGAVGIAVVRAAAERNLGIGAFVSMGNKCDVSGNDLMLAWQDDDRVSVIALYLESVGNPRRFSRIARFVSRSKPVLALKAGRGTAAQAAGQSHTAAAAAAEPVVEALFEQAGVQRVATLEQLLDAVRVIDNQPPPAGPRIGIVGNSGGPEILATDAAEAAGLQVPELSPHLRARIREIAPALASERNPVDLGAAVPAGQIESVLRLLIDSGEVDALVAVFAETLAVPPDEVRAAVAVAAGHSPRPVILVEVGGRPHNLPIGDTHRAIPVFGFPEPAVDALAVAVRAAAVAGRPTAQPRHPSDLQLAPVRTLIERAMAQGSGWLAPLDAAALLQACGITVASQEVTRGIDSTQAAAHRLGYPVVVKRAIGVHKSDTGGVFVDVRDEDGLREAVDALGDTDVLVQAMYSDGVELIVGGVQDAQFGPVVMTGPGGIMTELAGDHSLRLAPLSTTDAETMLSTPTMTRLLDGFRGRPAVSRAAFTDLILRVAWLIEHFPEVAELDLNPVVCRGDDLVAVDAKIRLAPSPGEIDPLSRMLTAASPG
jgi:acyl-CoA synthetase (NDP forming)/GNAT superfamily N-acetyltransferase